MGTPRMAILATVLLSVSASAHASTQAGNVSTETVSVPDQVPLATAAAKYTALIPETGPTCYKNNWLVWTCSYEFLVELTVGGAPAEGFTGDDYAERLYVIHPNGGDLMGQPVNYVLTLTEGDYDSSTYRRDFYPSSDEQNAGHMAYSLHICIDLKTDANSAVCKYWDHDLPVLADPTGTPTVEEPPAPAKVFVGLPTGVGR